MKESIICKEKGEMKVKDLAHEVQTYQVISEKSDSVYKSNIVVDEYEGFSLSVDLNISEKEKVVSSLKSALRDIEERHFKSTPSSKNTKK